MHFEELARGYYLEGLSVADGTVLFSDVIGGGIHKLSADGTRRSWFDDTRWLAAIVRNQDGSILYSGPHGIAWFNPASGEAGTLVESVDGGDIPGVNEMTPDHAGGLYFGTIDLPSIMAGKAPRPAALYHLDVEQHLTRLCGGLAFTNGLALSPDGSRLYHNESFAGISAYAVTSGGLGERVTLSGQKDCDGMALDEEGNLWVTGFGSDTLRCLRPDGTLLHAIELPAGAATNLRFGGSEGREWYVTTVEPEDAVGLAKGKLPERPSSVLYCGRSAVRGLAAGVARFQFK